MQVRRRLPEKRRDIPSCVLDSISLSRFVSFVSDRGDDDLDRFAI
jgi:hypothetical protein